MTTTANARARAKDAFAIDLPPKGGSRKSEAARYRRAARKIAKVRSDAEAQVERLIAMLDAMDGDIDLEPSLEGSSVGMDDREAEDEHDESTNDDEPSLGSRNPTIYGDQGSWSAGNDSDLEEEHCGREPDADEELHEPSGVADTDGLIEQLSGHSGVFIAGYGASGFARAVE